MYLLTRCSSVVLPSTRRSSTVMIRTAKMQATSVTTAPSSAPTEMIPRCRADRSSFSFSALSMTGTSRKDFLDYTPYPSH